MRDPYRHGGGGADAGRDLITVTSEEDSLNRLIPGHALNTSEPQSVTFEHLYCEPLVWFVRAGHPLAGKPTVAIQDLRDYQIVLPIRGTIIREEIDHYLVSMDAVNFPNVIETISFEFARSYLFGSDAVVTAPLGTMRHELEADKAVALDLGREQLTGSVGITSRSGTDLSPSAQLLIEMIRQELQALDLI